MEIFGVPLQAFLGQIILGLVNGAFYAVLSLGLAIIFGLLRIVNFAHGAFFMTGAFVAFILGRDLGLGYWPSLLVPRLWWACSACCSSGCFCAASMGSIRFTACC